MSEVMVDSCIQKVTFFLAESLEALSAEMHADNLTIMGIQSKKILRAMLKSNTHTFINIYMHIYMDCILKFYILFYSI